MNTLPIIRMGRKVYFIDRRLQEIRNVTNPFDSQKVSLEVIVYWIENKIEKV